MVKREQGGWVDSGERWTLRANLAQSRARNAFDWSYTFNLAFLESVDRAVEEASDLAAKFIGQIGSPEAGSEVHGVSQFGPTGYADTAKTWVTALLTEKLDGDSQAAERYAGVLVEKIQALYEESDQA